MITYVCECTIEVQIRSLSIYYALCVCVHLRSASVFLGIRKKLCDHSGARVCVLMRLEVNQWKRLGEITKMGYR